MVEMSFGLVDFFGFLTLGFSMAAGLFYPAAAGLLIYKGMKSA